MPPYFGRLLRTHVLTLLCAHRQSTLDDLRVSLGSHDFRPALSYLIRSGIVCTANKRGVYALNPAHPSFRGLDVSRLDPYKRFAKGCQ
jgi:hypothetical protein